MLHQRSRHLHLRDRVHQRVRDLDRMQGADLLHGRTHGLDGAAGDDDRAQDAPDHRRGQQVLMQAEAPEALTR